jgi:hypothetical protein
LRDAASAASLPIFARAAHHPQWMLREQAALGLGVLGNEIAVLARTPLSGDPAPQRRPCPRYCVILRVTSVNCAR